MIDFPRPRECLAPSRRIDCEHPSIAALATSLTEPTAGEIANAVSLHYWERDAAAAA